MDELKEGVEDADVMRFRLFRITKPSQASGC